ncbi:MAG: sugar transferase [Planctomycetota bacterium]|jgi:lipopolysaccharide/colanic/teichoic acid biosynthesis glycosyltransferase
MAIRIIFFIINVVLVNLGFFISFFIRYGLPIPQRSFLPYKNSFVFLTLIYLSTLVVFGVYKSRFKSSWDLFKRIFLGLFLGTLLSISFVYVFRAKWGAFPTSVFVISFFINLLLISKVNQFVLKAKKKIKKQVVILGEGKVDDIIGKKANVERKRIDQIRELFEYTTVDEIVVSEKITNAEDLNLLLYLAQKLKAEILFSPAVYMGLLPERINGSSSVELLSTFVGKRSDLDEFFIAILDISTSLILLILAMVPMLIISIFIKLTSRGTIIYKQQRVGKDGKVFTLYKFRTMVKDAEKTAGFSPAIENDPRITKIGKWLRITRLDELPQLLNVLKGQMSLVGPRPENLYRIETHKALQGLRLAVRPGITGLAQIRSYYDLNPKHKIKYDYLYIQRRTLWLNIYILLQTIPVIFSKKGW